MKNCTASVISVNLVIIMISTYRDYECLTKSILASNSLFRLIRSTELVIFTRFIKAIEVMVKVVFGLVGGNKLYKLLEM